MRDEPLFILIVLAVAATTLILMTGIGGFARGGAWNRKNGNRMMRWRIIAQAIAIALILLYAWLKG